MEFITLLRHCVLSKRSHQLEVVMASLGPHTATPLPACRFLVWNYSICSTLFHTSAYMTHTAMNVYKILCEFVVVCNTTDGRFN